MTMTSGEKFKHGNARLARMLADPETRREVDKIRAAMDQADREYRIGLATVRQAVNLTQVEMAQRLGISQGAVSTLENRDDLLISTLANYLAAAGGSNARVLVTIAGHDVELPISAPTPTT